jgi:hypothetical protein
VTKIEASVGKGKIDYLQWLDKSLVEKRQQAAANPPPPNLDALKTRIAELEKTRALYGKHPQPGRTIEPHMLAFAAPQVVTLPLPEGAHWLKVDTRLDMQNPEVDEASMQWTMTTETPRDVTKIIPGVLTIWKRSTKKSGETMNDFNKMKVAFPDMFERRLEEVANNLYRGGKPSITVYYFSDDQLGQILGAQDRKQLEAMKNDWYFVATPNPKPQHLKSIDDSILSHLHEFAKKAWRRPISEDETKKLDALYFASRAKELDRESAAREVLVRVLVSPNFLFKAETLPPIADAKTTEVPLNAHELASRLSYFLWASLPDWQLRKAADDGSLLKPEVLDAHTQRMLRDPKASALAKEFAGQWLKFNGFDAHNSVDEKKYPQFTAELRADMHREVVEFFTHLVRDDRNVSDIIGGDYTFLNERLAKHYGIPGVTGGDFREVKAAQQNRGGLLGMGAILTKTSSTLRSRARARRAWRLPVSGRARLQQPATAAERARAQRNQQTLQPSRGPHAAPHRLRLRRLPRAHRPARLRLGKLRPHRPLPPHRRHRRQNRRHRRNDGRHQVPRPRRPARLPQKERAAVPHPIHPQTPRLRPRPPDIAQRQKTPPADAGIIEGEWWEIFGGAAGDREKPAVFKSPRGTAGGGESVISVQRVLFENRLSLQKIKIAVELEQPCRGPADVRDSENACPISTEVVLPAVLAWIEETHGQVGVRVQAEEIGAFVQIAARTGERKVLLNRGTSMLLRHDVLDMKSGIDFILHLQATVLAAPERTLANSFPQFGVQNQAALRFWRKAPALSRRMDMSFPE